MSGQIRCREKTCGSLKRCCEVFAISNVLDFRTKLFENNRRNSMSYFVRCMSAAAVLATMMVGPVSAVSMAKISAPTAAAPPLVENVHLICDRYGRCYNSRRYVQRRYVQRRYFTAPGYSNYGYGPGYGYGSGYGYGGPSISFGFGGYGHHHHHW